VFCTPIYVLIALLNRHKTPLMLIYAHAPRTTTSGLLARASIGLHHFTHGSADSNPGQDKDVPWLSHIFLFFEGRASAASGTNSPHGLVDVHHHGDTVFLSQVSP
jgi:hypothetical protein